MDTHITRSERPGPAAAVAALARTAREMRTPCGDGDMVWRVWGAGEPLLLFHGGSGSWTHWIRTIPVLARRYQLWVPDLPGLGESAMPAEPWTPASVADAVVAGIDELLPDRPLRIVGFSFGGLIAGVTAARLGARLDARLRALVLVGVPALGLPMGPREPFAKLRSSMGREEIAAVHRKNLGILMLADSRGIDDLAVHLQDENTRRARFRSRPFSQSDELARALERVTAPLKTIWGTRDVIATPSLEARLAVMRSHHPELEVRLIDGSGHWVMYEAADAFNAALLDVLQEPGDRRSD